MKLSVIPVSSYLTQLHERVAKLGWQCFATKWAGMNARYAIECVNGHRFERLGSTLFRATVRCVQCKDLESKAHLHTTVTERGSTLLGTSQN